MSVLPILPHLVKPCHIAKRRIDIDEDQNRYTLTCLSWRWFEGWGVHVVDDVLAQIDKAILAKVGMCANTERCHCADDILNADNDLNIVEHYGQTLSEKELCDIWHSVLAKIEVRAEAQKRIADLKYELEDYEAIVG